MKELIRNCAWCFPPDGKGGRIGRERLKENQDFTDGICTKHQIWEYRRMLNNQTYTPDFIAVIKTKLSELETNYKPKL